MGVLRKNDYVLLVLGTALIAFAARAVFEPLGMVTGGFSGLAIILKKLTKALVPGGIPLGVSMTVLNIPLFILSLRMKGFHFLKRSLVGMLSLSAWLLVLPEFCLISDDMLLAAFYGGVIQGLGIGLAFAGKGTTGGTDMLAALIQKKIPWYSPAQILQVIDGMIVLFGALIFGVQMVFYSVIAIFLTSKISDNLIQGLKFSKAAYIITEKHASIAQSFLTELDHGVTEIPVRGGYSGADRIMLFCVVPKKEIVLLKELVYRIDPHAFVIVTDAREVLGEGFLQHE